MKVKAPGPVEVKAGQLIIIEGEPGREMYIIEDGKVEIFKATGSQERQIALLEAGDFFGEMAILEDMPRSASARAMTDCKLLLIDHSTFDQMLREYPETAVRMLRKLSGRLRIASTGSEKVRFPTRPAATARSPALAVPAGTRQPPDSPKEDEDDARRVGPPEEARPSKAELPVRGKLVAHPSGIEFPFPEKAEINIGRFDSVTGIHPDVDLSAVDTNQIISRRHARIVREGGKVYVFEEIGTPNGTFVNDERIHTGVRVELKDGDELRFGDVRMLYRAG